MITELLLNSRFAVEEVAAKRQVFIEDIIGKSNLRPDTQKRIHRRTNGRYSSLRGALAGMMVVNPAFHFTTDEFQFHPSSSEDRMVFLKRARVLSWQLRDEGSDGIHVETGYSDDIRRNGLRAKSCVAVMPEGDNTQLMKAHPRFFIEALRMTVIKFGKHAVPYKQPPVQGVDGWLTDIRSALVTLPDSSVLEPKDREQRLGLSESNILKPRTYLTTSDILPDKVLAIVRFPIREVIPCIKGTTVMQVDHLVLAGAILKGLLEEGKALIGVLEKRGITDDMSRTQRMIEILNAIYSRNSELARLFFLNCEPI